MYIMIPGLIIDIPHYEAYHGQKFYKPGKKINEVQHEQSTR